MNTPLVKEFTFTSEPALIIHGIKILRCNNFDKKRG